MLRFLKMLLTKQGLIFVLKKVLLPRFYKRYVVGNSLIEADVNSTFATRGCTSKNEQLSTKFYHLMLYYPEFAYVFFWRIGKGKTNKARLFTTDMNCKIFKSTQIAGGLMCYHPFASVINAKSIGQNFQFRNGLTIGNKGNDNAQLPRIGNDVTVGAQVVIIGDINIGNNVVIGAGSVVVKDVPDNSVVAGNPARVIKTLEND